MAKKWGSVRDIFFYYFIKNNLYFISFMKKYKKLISKGFCMTNIFQIMKNIKNYGRHGSGGFLKF